MKIARNGLESDKDCTGVLPGGTSGCLMDHIARH